MREGCFARAGIYEIRDQNGEVVKLQVDDDGFFDLDGLPSVVIGVFAKPQPIA